jgi:hypothetical protein
MVNSGLPQYQFENAGDHMGAPGLVISSVCNSTDHNLMLNCAILLHSFDRDSYDADIALMVAPQLSGFVCGAADPGAFNRPTISKNNHAFAFAAVALSCNLGNFFTASHEVLHLMNIEHRFGDIQVNTPVSYNHA